MPVWTRWYYTTPRSFDTPDDALLARARAEIDSVLGGYGADVLDRDNPEIVSRRGGADHVVRYRGTDGAAVRWMEANGMQHAIPPEERIAEGEAP